MRKIPEIIKIKTGIKDAHHFDAYFEVIYNVFEEIKKDNEGAEVYVIIRPYLSVISLILTIVFVNSGNS